MTDTNYLSLWKERLSSSGRRPLTVRFYERDAQRFLNYLSSINTTIADITPDTILDYFTFGLPSSYSIAHRAAAALLGSGRQDGHEKGFLPFIAEELGKELSVSYRDVMEKAPRKNLSPREPLQSEMFQKIMAGVRDKHEGEFDYLASRDATLITLIVSPQVEHRNLNHGGITGILNATEKDLDIICSNGTIDVTIRTPRRKNVYHIPSAGNDDIRHYKDTLGSFREKLKNKHPRFVPTNDAFLNKHGTGISSRSVRRMIKGYCSKADLPQLSLTEIRLGTRNNSNGELD